MSAMVGIITFLTTSVIIECPFKLREILLLLIDIFLDHCVWLCVSADCHYLCGARRSLYLVIRLLKSSSEVQYAAI